MHVRLWCIDGSVVDRPASIVWDGAPLAEWICDVERVVTRAQVFDGTRPLTTPWACMMPMVAEQRALFRLQLPMFTA